jgi:hypothetical protein
MFSLRRLGVLDAVASTKPFFRPPVDPLPVAHSLRRLCEFRQVPRHGACDGRVERHGVVTSLSSYSPPVVPNASALMGASPSATLVNVVTLFSAFFQSFGALVVFFAIVSWRSVVNGQANRSQMGCFVRAVFGIMLINILAITNALVAMFVT